jgi:hypothetical protein
MKPRRSSAVPNNPLKTLRLGGCLLGCSPVPSVPRNPLKTLASAVLGGPSLLNPYTPIALGRALGRSPQASSPARTQAQEKCGNAPPLDIFPSSASALRACLVQNHVTVRPVSVVSDKCGSIHGTR